VQASSAFGILLILAGPADLAFGTYALLRGGKHQQGKIGPIPERGVHLIAGARMFLVGALCLAGGIYLLASLRQAPLVSTHPVGRLSAFQCVCGP
jgi:hypothetical protein